VSGTANIDLISTGNPDHVGLETNVRRALDQARQQTADAATSVESYAPASSGSWAAPAPTTQDVALDRIAAAVAGILGTPIP
jgi:hypothetical protein